MTGDELARLVEVSASAGCPALLALSVVGGVELTPADSLDSRVATAFDAHQRRDRGAGRLLGPDAVAAAVDGFTRHGLDVTTRPSPWRLGPDGSALARAWLDGWVGAAREQRPELSPRLGDWVRRRHAQAAAGRLSVTVDHVDLLAVPR